MLIVRICAVLLCAVLMSFAFAEAGSSGVQGIGPDNDDKQLAALKEWLGRLPDVPKEGSNRETVALNDATVRRILPHHAFYRVNFYKDAPHPGPLSEPLNLNNLFDVLPDGSVVQLKDKDDLAEFLKSKLDRVQGDNRTRDAALACLHLAEGLFQDGHYKLKVMEPVSIENDGGHVTAVARSAVQNKDQGEITVTLTIGETGKISKIDLKSTLRPTRGRRR